MGFEKGNKLGGRKKNSTNKATGQIREAIQLIVEDNIQQIERDLVTLEPSQRVKYFIDLLSFVQPKLKATEIALGESRTINIKPIQWVD